MRGGRSRIRRNSRQGSRRSQTHVALRNQPLPEVTRTLPPFGAHFASSAPVVSRVQMDCSGFAGAGVVQAGSSARHQPITARAQRSRGRPGGYPSLAKDSITSRHNDHREAGLPSKRDRHTERQSMVTTHDDHNRPGRSTLVGDR